MFCAFFSEVIAHDIDGLQGAVFLCCPKIHFKAFEKFLNIIILQTNDVTDPWMTSEHQ
jgi:hypothetical protein